MALLAGSHHFSVFPQAAAHTSPERTHVTHRRTQPGVCRTGWVRRDSLCRPKAQRSELSRCTTSDPVSEKRGPAGLKRGGAQVPAGCRSWAGLKSSTFLSPSSMTTWRQLGLRQFKKQLHLKAISVLIAERLLSCCLAAGSHLVPGTWEPTFGCCRQPARPGALQGGAGLLRPLTLPRPSSDLKVLLTGERRRGPGEAEALLHSLPSSTADLACDLGQVHAILWADVPSCQ